MSRCRCICIKADVNHWKFHYTFERTENRKQRPPNPQSPMKKAALKLITWSLSVFAFACVAQAGTITNNFTTARDYVVNGIIGETNWDGVYLGFGDIPGGGAG